MPVVYLVLEGIDNISRSEDFCTLLQHLKSLTSPDVIQGKVIKVLLTSTRPDGGFHTIFSGAESTEIVDNNNNVLVRIPNSANRSRRIPQKRSRRVMIPSSSDIPPEPTHPFKPTSSKNKG